MGKFYKCFSVVIALSLLLLIIGCGTKDTSSTDFKEDQNVSVEYEQMTLKFGHHLAEDHILSKQAAKFAELVSEKTDGKVKVDIYPAGQLGEQKDLLEGLQIGTVDMTVVDTGVLANFYEPLAILDAPYIFNSYDHAVNALKGELGKILKEDILSETGIRVLALEPTSFRSTALSEKAVKSVDNFSLQDFKGLKIRVSDSPSVIETFKRFGAQAVTIPSGEVYSAIESGVVSGMESNPEFLKSINANEVAKYLVDTKHVLVNQAIAISDSKYNSLPQNIQEVIQDAVNESTEWFIDVAEEADQEARKELEEKGMVIIEVDLTPYKEVAFPYTEQFIEDNDLENLYKLIQEEK